MHAAVRGGANHVTRQAWLLFAAISFLWGLPYLFIKVAVRELDPAVIVLGRVAIAAAVLVPLATARGAFVHLRGRWRPLILLAVIEMAAPFLLIAYGEQHITSSLAGLLIAADPLFIALLALRLDPSERVDSPRLLGLVVGIVGVVALLGLDVGGDALGLLGAGMVLAAALCYAGGALLIKRSFSDIPQLGAIAAGLALATLMVAPLALLRLPAHAPTPPVAAAVLALGLLCTALGFLTYFKLIAVAGASRASVITYVNPAIAVALGVLVLAEPLSLATLGGFALVLIGCWLSTGGGPPRWLPLAGSSTLKRGGVPYWSGVLPPHRQ
jgi:drug/metabolite transporter (DMT)-like permease